MSITINLIPFLQPYAENKESVKVTGKTIRECLDNLVKRYPNMKKMLMDDKGNIFEYVTVFNDNEIIYEGKWDKPVKDGEQFHILIIIGGG